MAAKIKLVVKEKVKVTDKVYFVTFTVSDPPTIEFKAGQNMMLMIAPGINRTMSIASPPSSSHELLMVHDVTPMGPGSQWTVNLSVGDTATIVAPTGGALILADSPKKKVMIATGTGIAPFHAMILDTLSKSEAPMTLYWGQRYERDIYWRDEFDAIAQKHPAFSWRQILSRPGEGWNGLTGHVTEHVLALESDKSNSEFYLCGNKAMVEEMRNALVGEQVPAAQIKSELFY